MADSSRDSKTHTLKTYPEEFQGIFEGISRHTVRKFDRDFLVGDVVRFREYDKTKRKYKNRFTGREIGLKIGHITKPGEWGLPADVGVLSLNIVY